MELGGIEFQGHRGSGHVRYASSLVTGGSSPLSPLHFVTIHGDYERFRDHAVTTDHVREATISALVKVCPAGTTS